MEIYYNCTVTAAQNAATALSVYCETQGANLFTCVENAEAQIPTYYNCPGTNVANTVDENTMAMVCNFENLYWNTWSSDISPFIRRKKERQEPSSLPDFVPALGLTAEKRGLALPTLKSSTAHDLKNRTTHLAWADDGNLIASTTGNSFSSLNGYFVGEGTNNRLLHLYSGTMATLGVSRLRLASLDAMPIGSILV